ncbi:MAG TPA: DUF2813 domain-containing protein, partial [Longimicrobiales bacterium]|nr:DUF2813 domain-containing protein [Longimicrobiales bacterium]
MHLSHVHIENFRGISRLDLVLDPLTVVIGENNHGKTSLFDVLDRCLGGPGGGETGVWEYQDFRRTADGDRLTIRVVLTFDPVGAVRPGSLTHKLIAPALAPDGEGGPRLHVEFVGDPGTGTMRHRFLDDQGGGLDVPDSDTVLRRLRQLHPVLLIRLAQPQEPGVLEWARPEDSAPYGENEDESPEEAITRVYHRLAAARGPVPGRELRHAFL